MPSAIQFGMTEEQFWYGDLRLLMVYEKAYYRHASFNAWYQGQYNHVAYGITMQNMFAKKGAKKEEYPKWKDPFTNIKKTKITTENIEEEFRKQQAEQQDWLFNR